MHRDESLSMVLYRFFGIGFNNGEQGGTAGVDSRIATPSSLVTHQGISCNGHRAWYLGRCVGGEMSRHIQNSALVQVKRNMLACLNGRGCGRQWCECRVMGKGTAISCALNHGASRWIPDCNKCRVYESSTIISLMTTWLQISVLYQ